MPNDSAQQKQTDTDTPVEIIGYVTDPKRVGYQILTNYECTYWRPLVGNDAWGLYEVLRSFCHEGNNTCRPSISLLTDIISASDRRHITGRIEVKNGKEYNTPGLLDILQEHNLIVVEEKWRGPNLRYVFHVDLTPGLLTTEQLGNLSKRLRQKHSSLIQKISQEQDELGARVERKKKRKKRGVENTQGGLENLHTPPGESPDRTTPIEQYPHTTTVAKEKDNNNSGGEQEGKEDVVVALVDIGISKRVAKRLAHRHSRSRVLEKIAFLEYLQEKKPGKIKNPKGWLRRAIEENYAPPDGYKTPEQLAAEEEEKKRRQEEAEEAVKRHEEEKRKAEEKERQERERRVEELRKEYETPEKYSQVWEQVLERASPELGLNMGYLSDSHLLAVEGEKGQVMATIAVTSGYIKRALDEGELQVVSRALAKELGKERVHLKFVVV